MIEKEETSRCQAPSMLLVSVKAVVKRGLTKGRNIITGCIRTDCLFCSPLLVWPLPTMEESLWQWSRFFNSESLKV